MESLKAGISSFFKSRWKFLAFPCKPELFRLFIFKTEYHNKRNGNRYSCQEIGAGNQCSGSVLRPGRALDWLRKLRDMTARIAVYRRVNRIELGNFGDHKFCHDGVWELRIDVGAEYRGHQRMLDKQLASRKKDHRDRR